MTLTDVARALRERRTALVASILVALVAGAAIFLIRPPTYTATLTVYAAPRAADPAASTPDAAYQGSLLAKERIPSYVQLVTSPQVVSQVIARAGLATTVTDFTPRVTATNALDSVLVDVAVDAPTAEEAARTASAYAEVLPAAVAQIEQAGAPVAPSVSLRAILPVPVPGSPSTPGLGLTLAVALLAGILVGLAVALVRDALDRTVRTPADLDGALAGTAGPEGAPPVLAALPPATRAAPVLEDSRSAGAEAYRRLRTALAPGRQAAPGVVAVTSPGSGEGRTTVVVNLASAAAAAGLGVVVVDADLRRPRVSGVLGLRSGDGLTDVLAGRVDADRAVRGSGSGFDVLPTGPLPSNPSELLAAGGLDTVLAALHERYDLVLVDTPPTLPVTDAALVAALADGVVVLARTRRTRRDDLAEAVRTLTAGGATVRGTVLVGAAGGPTLLVDPGVRSPIAPRAPRRAEPTAPPAGREPRTATAATRATAATHATTPAPTTAPSADGRGPGPRGVVAAAPDPRGPDPRGPDPRGPDPRGPATRTPGTRTPGTRTPDGAPAGSRPGREPARTNGVDVPEPTRPPGAVSPERPPSGPPPQDPARRANGARTASRGPDGVPPDGVPLLAAAGAARRGGDDSPARAEGGGGNGDGAGTTARLHGTHVNGTHVNGTPVNGTNGTSSPGRAAGTNGSGRHGRHGRPDPDAPPGL